METGDGGPTTRRDFLKKVGAIAFLTATYKPGAVPLSPHKPEESKDILTDETKLRIREITNYYKELGGSKYDKASMMLAVCGFLTKTKTSEIRAFYEATANPRYYNYSSEEDAITTSSAIIFDTTENPKTVKKLLISRTGSYESLVVPIRVALSSSNNFDLSRVVEIENLIAQAIPDLAPKTDLINKLFNNKKVENDQIRLQLASIVLSGRLSVDEVINKYSETIGKLKKIFEGPQEPSGRYTHANMELDCVAVIAVMAESFGLSFDEFCTKYNEVRKYKLDSSERGSVDACLVLAYAMERNKDPGITVEEIMAIYKQLGKNLGIRATVGSQIGMVLGLFSQDNKNLILATYEDRKRGGHFFTGMVPLMFKNKNAG